MTHYYGEHVIIYSSEEMGSPMIAQYMDVVTEEAGPVMTLPLHTCHPVNSKGYGACLTTSRWDRPNPDP